MVRLRFETDLSTSLKAGADLAKAYKKVGDEVKLATKEMNALEKSAKRLVDQNLSPQERYNQKLETMAKAVRTGRLSMEDAERTAARLRVKLEETGKAAKQAFGSESIDGLASFAQGFVGIGAAISGVTALFRIMEDEAQGAADRVFQSYAAAAALQAVGGGPADVAFARALVSRGIVSKEKGAEAFDITAGLMKARLTPAERETVAKYGEADILKPQELVEFGRGIREFRDVFKSTETFDDVAAMLIEAGKTAKVTPGEVGAATTRFGRAATEQGFTGPEALAAYATIMQTAPSQRTAATRAEKFFKGEYKMTPEEQAMYTRQQAAIRGAPGAAVVNPLVAGDPRLAAADLLQTRQGALAQKQEDLSAEVETLFDTFVAEEKTFFTNRRDRVGSAFASMVYGLSDVLGGDEAALRNAFADPRGRARMSPELQSRIEDFLKRTAESNERMEQGLQAPVPHGRAE